MSEVRQVLVRFCRPDGTMYWQEFQDLEVVREGDVEFAIYKGFKYRVKYFNNGIPYIDVV